MSFKSEIRNAIYHLAEMGADACNSVMKKFEKLADKVHPEGGKPDDVSQADWDKSEGTTKPINLPKGIADAKTRDE